MRLSNFFIESIGLYLPETYSTESAVADGYLDADTREKTGWTGTGTAEPDSRVDLSGQGLDPMCANRVASTMRFTERAAMVVRIIGEEAGDRIWIPLSPPRLESADPFGGAHRSLRHRS